MKTAIQRKRDRHEREQRMIKATAPELIAYGRQGAAHRAEVIAELERRTVRHQQKAAAIIAAIDA